MVTSGGISVTKSLRVGIDATIGGNLTANGTFTLLSSALSTNTTTGAAVITGGVGIGGAVNIGGALAITGTSTFSSATSFVGVATFSNVTDATASNLGSIVTLGGLGIAKSAYVGTNLTVVGSSILVGLTVSGVTSFTNTTPSTAYGNGAVILSGGIGIAGNINSNGGLTVAGTTVIGGLTTFTNTTDSPSLTIASVIYSGGVAVTKNLNVGGGFSVGATALFTGAITNTVGSFSLNSVQLTDMGGLLYSRSAAPGIRIASTDAIKTTQYVNTIDLFSLGNLFTDVNYELLQLTTTSTNTYTMQTRANGTGIVRRLTLQTGTNSNQVLLNIDGTVSLGSTTADSSAVTSGSVVVSGGLGVQGSISIGKTWRMFGQLLETSL